MVMLDDNMNVNIKAMNNNLITTYISDFHNSFWITYMYGHPQLHLRHVWGQLTMVAQSLHNDDKWIVLGDFNQVLLKKDKLSFSNNQLRGAYQLKESLNQCIRSEIPPKGQYLA